MKKIITQLIRFGIVGVIATVIDVGALMLFKELLRLDVLIASALSFSISVTANYILSMLWVFKSKGDGKVKEFIIFVTLSIGGLLLNQFIMWFGTEISDSYYLFVKLFALFVVPIYNFITRKVFLEKKTS